MQNAPPLAPTDKHVDGPNRHVCPQFNFRGQRAVTRVGNRLQSRAGTALEERDLRSKEEGKAATSDVKQKGEKVLRKARNAEEERLPASLQTFEKDPKHGRRKIHDYLRA